MFSLPVLIARGLDLQLCRQPCFFLPFLFSFEGVIPQIVGVFNGEGPPVPIPNTEVKLTSADNTCLETDREDRSMPTSKGLAQVKPFAFASLAQQVEHAAVNRRVVGSNPTGGAKGIAATLVTAILILGPLAQLVRATGS